MAATSINCLAVVLKELDWSYTRLITELRRQAAIDGVVLPRSESLIPRISRWVNNHQQPDDFYRDLLSRATGRLRFELFSDEAAVALLAARTNSGIAPIVAVGSDEDMNRRQLLARTAALAAALAADPLVSMPGTVTPGGSAPTNVQAATVGEVEREIVAAIRRVLFGLGSPGAGSEWRDALDVESLDYRVHTVWRLRQGSHYVELGQALPGLLADAHLASRELTGDQQALAFALLAHSYNTASSLLRKLGDDGLAMIAADRAVQTARTVSEPLLLAACAYRLANAFLPAGRIVKPRRLRCPPLEGWNLVWTPLRHTLRPGAACCSLLPSPRPAKATAGRYGSWWARPKQQPADSGSIMRISTQSSARPAWRSRVYRWQPSSATAARSCDGHGLSSPLACRHIWWSGVRIS